MCLGVTSLLLLPGSASAYQFTRMSKSRRSGLPILAMRGACSERHSRFQKKDPKPAISCFLILPVSSIQRDYHPCSLTKRFSKMADRQLSNCVANGTAPFQPDKANLALFTDENRQIYMSDSPALAPGPDECIVRMRCNGICG